MKKQHIKIIKKKKKFMKIMERKNIHDRQKHY